MKLIFSILLMLFFSVSHAQEFTVEEKNWMDQNPVIYYGFDPSWKPLEFTEDGRHVGVSRDYLDIIEQETGLTFKQHENIKNWSDAKSLFNSGEVLLLTAIAINEERSKIMDFTEPYLSFPFVIVTKSEGDYIGSVQELIGKKIAVPKNYFITNILESEDIDFKLIYKDNVEECLMAITTNEADATIANLCVVSHYLNYRGYKNLKIAAPTDYPEMETRMGVSKNTPELTSIMNKVMGSISVKRSNEIMNKWVSVSYNEGVPIAVILKYGGISLVVILIIILGILYWNRTLKKEIKLRHQAEKELQKSMDEISEQSLIIEEHNKEIMDSIQYAKRIQMAILPPEEDFKKHFPESFIYYEPKDVVAGDFYWMATIEDTIFFAVADCTGHGVPGAMVSVICSNALNKAVNEMKITDPGKILDEVQKIVINRFERSKHTVRDGMDISLVALRSRTESESRERSVEILWSGANNPLWIIRKNTTEIEEIKANKQPIGNYHKIEPFTTHEVSINEGDSIYLFSDGYADQFGGSKMKKLKSKNFKNHLIQIQELTLGNQKNNIEKAFHEWKGDMEQVDDVCVIGVRL